MRIERCGRFELDMTAGHININVYINIGRDGVGVQTITHEDGETIEIEAYCGREIEARIAIVIDSKTRSERDEGRVRRFQRRVFGLQEDGQRSHVIEFAGIYI